MRLPVARVLRTGHNAVAGGDGIVRVHETVQRLLRVSPVWGLPNEREQVASVSVARPAGVDGLGGVVTICWYQHRLRSVCEDSRSGRRRKTSMDDAVAPGVGLSGGGCQRQSVHHWQA